MKRHFVTLLSILLATNCFADSNTFTFGTNTHPDGTTFQVDANGFIIGGKHVLPVMGEIHYARVPAKEWRREICKMKAGGVTVIATYCFWIHHEAEEGKWDWSGNKDLHSFLEICKEEGMPVVLRIGPFCHGEVYNGGFPDWIVSKSKQDPQNFKLRSMAPGFIAATQRLYSNIYAQASDMLWKNGGPIVGIQIENECRGPWNYLMKLKDMAVSIGFDLPFYTRTGWPKLNGKEEFGKLLPLYGDYADGFWDSSTKDMPGEYPKSFIFKNTRLSGVIATETFGTNQDTKMNTKELQYPYLTCELGGGMMQAYHRRINMNGNEPFPLAICKVGSGSNLPGYYMYHGGTNPAPIQDKTGATHSMGETVKAGYMNNNDMPYMSYDFQSPLGEMGQPNINAFHQTRWFHQFLADWGDTLSVMDVDSLSEHYARRGFFEFHNDYVRILNEDGVAYVKPLGMPFMGHVISADAQPFCKIGNALYLINIKGMKPSVIIDGKKYSLKNDKTQKIRDITVTLLSPSQARKAYKIDNELHFAKNDGGILYKMGDVIYEEYWHHVADNAVTANITKVAGEARTVNMASEKRKVAAMPSDKEFDNAAIYTLTFDKIPELYGKSITADNCDSLFLKVNYIADCARIYADEKLVEDNFWNGKPMLVRLSDLYNPETCSWRKVELRILPLRKDAPIYFQKEQRDIINAASGNSILQLNGISLFSY